jgi:hypothetical protein
VLRLLDKTISRSAQSCIDISYHTQIEGIEVDLPGLILREPRSTLLLLTWPESDFRAL